MSVSEEKIMIIFNYQLPLIQIIKNSMRNIYLFLFFFLCTGCANDKIKLNDMKLKFDAFPLDDSLNFISMSNSIVDNPSKMLIYKDNLIIQTFCNSKDKHLVIFSLKENKVVNEAIKYGEGPEEMLSCDICLADDKLWLYDMSKMQIGFIPIDSFLLGDFNVNRYKLGRYYYRTTMLSDSIMLGTNDLNSKSKISYVNIITGNIIGRGTYSYLDDNANMGALIDACSCYIDVNPKTKDILLSYRYTDIIEIYNSEGELKYSLQGPEGFDIEFQSKGGGMGKTQNTRKSFVNSYVTESSIYLLYSGSKRTEKNWAYGTEIFVFSWDGKPQKRYLLEQPIYAFAIDEDKQLIYSFSVQKEELIKAAM